MAQGHAAIEIKAVGHWQKRFNRNLHRIRQEFGAANVRCYGVFLGERAACWDDVNLLPVADFLRQLWGGEILR